MLKTKQKIVWVGVLLLAMMFCACGKDTVENSTIDQYIQQTMQDTAKVIETNDAEAALDIWSSLTQQSIALESVNGDLSKAVADVAANYEYLVNYCKTGDSSYLEQFSTQQSIAYENMNAVLTKCGYQTMNLQQY